MRRSGINPGDFGTGKNWNTIRQNNDERKSTDPSYRAPPARQAMRTRHDKRRHVNPAGRKVPTIPIIHPQRYPIAGLKPAPTLPLEPQLLPSVNGDASVGALGTAERARLGRHKDLIRELVDSNAMGVGAGGHIDEPQARCGIDYAQDRAVGHVSAGGVVAVVAGVV